MSLFRALLAASALSALTAAAPSPPWPTTGPKDLTFSVEPKAAMSKVSLLEMKLATMKKFNLTIDYELQTLADSEVAAEDFDKITYLVPLDIGSQTFELIFDTGSSDLWLMSDSLPASEQPKGYNPFHPGSGAVLLPNYTFHISYVGGPAAKGAVYASQVTLGNATVTSQAVEAATSINAAAKNQFKNVDGIIGAAFSSLNSVKLTKQNTFFTNLQTSLASPIFTTALIGKSTGSSIDFGYIDSSKYVGDITYVPVVSKPGFWKFHVGTYSVGGTANNTTIGPAIVDTGTSLMYLPSAIVTAYYDNIPGAKNSASFGGWIFPCSQKLPAFTLHIAGHPVTVHNHQLNYGKVADGYCFGGMQSLSSGPSILGDVFLRSTFVIWDQSPSMPRLGFAHKAY